MFGTEAEKLSSDDPVNWIEKNFYIPETKDDPVLRGRFKFMPHQADIIREIFSKDERGLYKYDTIVYSAIKKSWKSSIAAAVALYICSHSDWGEGYIVANDLKQADSRVAHYIRRAIELNPDLKKIYGIRGYRITASSGSYLEAIPIDPSGEAGSNADFICFSELWGANEDAKHRMWAEMTIPPGKHGKAFRWVESYAGFTEESELLYSLYDLGVNQGELLWPDKLYPVTEGEPAPLEVYVNKQKRLFCYWETHPRLPDQTREYYASEAGILLPNDYTRMHQNGWASNTDTFVPIEWVYACDRKNEPWPEYDKKRHNHIISLDAAVSDDCFALWMGCRHPERSDEIVTVYCQVWKPPKGKVGIDFQGTDEFPGPEKVVERLIKEYNVIQVCYDPTQLHDMATRLKKKSLTWFYSFNQGERRLKADGQLRDIIRDRRLWHRGEPELIEHFKNADAQVDKEDRKLRIVKRVEKLKIDMAVAISMGSYELLRLNL